MSSIQKLIIHCLVICDLPICCLQGADASTVKSKALNTFFQMPYSAREQPQASIQRVEMLDGFAAVQACRQGLYSVLEGQPSQGWESLPDVCQPGFAAAFRSFSALSSSLCRVQGDCLIIQVMLSSFQVGSEA